LLYPECERPLCAGEHDWESVWSCINPVRCDAPGKVTDGISEAIF
jgi:hypothetical protein